MTVGGLAEDVLGPLRQVQNDLFDVGADLCTPIDERPEVPAAAGDRGLRRRGWRAGATRSTRGCPSSTRSSCPAARPGPRYLHVARTVTRRAERSVWALLEVDAERTNPLTAQLPQPALGPAVHPGPGREPGRRRAVAPGRRSRQPDRAPAQVRRVDRCGARAGRGLQPGEEARQHAGRPSPARGHPRACGSAAPRPPWGIAADSASVGGRRSTISSTVRSTTTVGPGAEAGEPEPGQVVAAVAADAREPARSAFRIRRATPGRRRRLTSTPPPWMSCTRRTTRQMASSRQTASRMPATSSVSPTAGRPATRPRRRLAAAPGPASRPLHPRVPNGRPARAPCAPGRRRSPRRSRPTPPVS